MDFARQRAQLVLLQRQNGSLVGRQRRMQVQHRAHVAALQLLLLVSIAQECQHHAVNTQRRLDAVGDVALVRHRVEVFQRLAGMVLMLRQVVIRAVGDAPEFTPAEWE